MKSPLCDTIGFREIFTRRHPTFNVELWLLDRGKCEIQLLKSFLRFFLDCGLIGYKCFGINKT